MLVTGGMLCGGDFALVKMVGTRLPMLPQKRHFCDYALGIVFLIPMIQPILEAKLTKRQVGLFSSARCVAHRRGRGVVLCHMARIPIAEVTAMNYLSPVYVTIGAALFLGENAGVPARLRR